MVLIFSYTIMRIEELSMRMMNNMVFLMHEELI